MLWWRWYCNCNFIRVIFIILISFTWSCFLFWCLRRYIWFIIFKFTRWRTYRIVSWIFFFFELLRLNFEVIRSNVLFFVFSSFSFVGAAAQLVFVCCDGFSFSNLSIPFSLLLWRLSDNLANTLPRDPVVFDTFFFHFLLRLILVFRDLYRLKISLVILI